MSAAQFGLEMIGAVIVICVSLAGMHVASKAVVRLRDRLEPLEDGGNRDDA